MLLAAVFVSLRAVLPLSCCRTLPAAPVPLCIQTQHKTPTQYNTHLKQNSDEPVDTLTAQLVGVGAEVLGGALRVKELPSQVGMGGGWGDGLREGSRSLL